jgi:hypothetical protein
MHLRNSLVFCESTCGAHMFIIISHLSPPRYNCLVVHVGLHNHLNAKGENGKALNKLNLSRKMYLEENLNASPNTISCKLVQQKFL